MRGPVIRITEERLSTISQLCSIRRPRARDSLRGYQRSLQKWAILPCCIPVLIGHGAIVCL